MSASAESRRKRRKTLDTRYGNSASRHSQRQPRSKPHAQSLSQPRVKVQRRRQIPEDRDVFALIQRHEYAEVSAPRQRREYEESSALRDVFALIQRHENAEVSAPNQRRGDEEAEVNAPNQWHEDEEVSAPNQRREDEEVLVSSDERCTCTCEWKKEHMAGAESTSESDATTPSEVDAGHCSKMDAEHASKMDAKPDNNLDVKSQNVHNTESCNTPNSVFRLPSIGTALGMFRVPSKSVASAVRGFLDQRYSEISSVFASYRTWSPQPPSMGSSLLESLNDDLLLEVFDYLYIRELCVFRVTNKRTLRLSRLNLRARKVDFADRFWQTDDTLKQVLACPKLERLYWEPEPVEAHQHFVRTLAGIPREYSEFTHDSASIMTLASKVGTSCLTSLKFWHMNFAVLPTLWKAFPNLTRLSVKNLEELPLFLFGPYFPKLEYFRCDRDSDYPGESLKLCPAIFDHARGMVRRGNMEGHWMQLLKDFGEELSETLAWEVFTHKGEEHDVAFPPPPPNLQTFILGAYVLDDDVALQELLLWLPTTLRCFELRSPNIIEVGHATIIEKRFRNLESLSFKALCRGQRGGEMSKKYCKALSASRSLRSLRVEGLKPNEISSATTTLESLHIDLCRRSLIEDNIVVNYKLNFHFEHMKNLTRLTLHNRNRRIKVPLQLPTGACRQLGKLAYLSLRGFDLSRSLALPQSLAQIGELRALEHVALEDCDLLEKDYGTFCSVLARTPFDKLDVTGSYRQVHVAAAALWWPALHLKWLYVKHLQRGLWMKDSPTEGYFCRMNTLCEVSGSLVGYELHYEDCINISGKVRRKEPSPLGHMYRYV